MKYLLLAILPSLITTMFSCHANEVPVAAVEHEAEIKHFKADDPHFLFVGRIDFSNKLAPKFWSPGVYIKASFEGTQVTVLLTDELLWGNSHNYVSIVIDNEPAKRIKLKERNNELNFDGLTDVKHTILICKSTESQIGYLEFTGLKCRKLLTTKSQSRKIEFYGNSITSGMGVDQSAVACDKGVWYDQHNAYLAYGPITARALNADWMLTSVSGIGLMHSCCNMTITMPQVYDKVNLHQNDIAWNFSYQPDVVTVCLGQNDGIQDSTTFCSRYVNFIGDLRSKYPQSTIILLTSPMADQNLVGALKNYITAIVEHLHSTGDLNLHRYFFSKQYINGCGYHPDMKDHEEIAAELTDFIKQIKNW